MNRFLERFPGRHVPFRRSDIVARMIKNLCGAEVAKVRPANLLRHKRYHRYHYLAAGFTYKLKKVKARFALDNKTLQNIKCPSIKVLKSFLGFFLLISCLKSKRHCSGFL